jgi:hypothetical protein
MLLLLLLLTLPALVQAQFIYTTNNGTITITGHTGTLVGALTIPSTINGLPVTSIGSGAFQGTGLTSVTIPNSVISIGTSAFFYCTSLASVTIPNSVTTIGDSAFCNCDRLANLTIPDSVTSIGYATFSDCNSLTSVTIPDSVTNLAGYAFQRCTLLARVTIGNSVMSIGEGAFSVCTNLTSVTIPNSVISIGTSAFVYCSSLASVTIPNSVTNIGTKAFCCCGLTNLTIPNSVISIGDWAFFYCTNLTSVTIPNSVTNIGDLAFYYCTDLWGVYFEGNAPSLGGASVFASDNNTTVYYWPGTTGWGTAYGGRPTAVWWIPPAIQGSPQTQTAEAGSAVGLQVQASGPLLFCLWYFNYTNLIICSTNCELQLTNVQFSQSGAYTAVITNAAGAVTSSPAMLQVIAAVEHRPVWGVKVTGQTASLLNVDYASSLSRVPSWTTLGSVSLTSTSQYYFDLTLPLPPQRYFRAWQTGVTGVIPSLDLHLVPAITLTGNIGASVRVEAINQFGPADAWVTLGTVTLTNTSQLYFDVSALGQPQRLYRLVQVP